MSDWLNRRPTAFALIEITNQEIKHFIMPIETKNRIVDACANKLRH